MDAYIYNIFNIIYISKIYELEPKLKNNCFKNFKDFIWERTMICDIFVKKTKITQAVRNYLRSHYIVYRFTVIFHHLLPFVINASENIQTSTFYNI